MKNASFPGKGDADVLNRDPITGEPGAHPVETGVGAIGGAVAGALLGAIAGPVGAAVVGTLGAIAGGYVGKETGETLHPTGEELYWRDAYRSEPYFNTLYTYDDYAPAYRAGYSHRLERPDGLWNQVEPELEARWELDKETSRLPWDEARLAAQAAWVRAGTSVPVSKLN